jgi:AcrR family transcriptional regulator
LLLSEAASLFARRGYHSTGVADIAAAAGISKPTLYHYFSSKDEILFSIHSELMDQLISRLEGRLTMRMTASQSLLEVMGDILELMDTHRGHVRVFWEHYQDLAEEHQEPIFRKRRRYEEMIQGLIEAGVASGEFRPLDARLTALALFGMCNWTYQWFRSDGPLRNREIAYAFWDLVLHGMQAEQDVRG